MQEQPIVTLSNALFIPKLFSGVFALSAVVLWGLKYFGHIELEELFPQLAQPLMIGAAILVFLLQFGRRKFFSHIMNTTTTESADPLGRYSLVYFVPLILGDAPAILSVALGVAIKPAGVLCGLTFLNAVLCWPNTDEVRRLRGKAGIAEGGQKLR